jgi:hypothetical protein
MGWVEWRAREEGCEIYPPLVLTVDPPVTIDLRRLLLLRALFGCVKAGDQGNHLEPDA